MGADEMKIEVDGNLQGTVSVDGKRYSIGFLSQFNAEATEHAMCLFVRIVNIYYEFQGEGDRTLGMCLQEHMDAADSILKSFALQANTQQGGDVELAAIDRERKAAR